MRKNMHYRALTSNFISQCLEDAVYLLHKPECGGIGDAPGSVIQVAEMLLKLRMLYAIPKNQINTMFCIFDTEKPEVPWQVILKEEEANK